MNKREFLEGLGLPPPKYKDKIITPDKETANVANSTHNPSNIDKELNRLKAQVLEIEKHQKNGGQVVNEKLNHTSNALAELQNQIKTNPAITKGYQILDTSKELQSRLKKLEEIQEAAKCPDCGKVVGWDDLPTKWYNESELQPTEQSSIFPWMFSLHGKKCPICNHFEEVKQ